MASACARPRGKETVILVNPTEEPAPMPASLRKGLRVAVPAGAGSVPDTLPRYGVLVMEPAGGPGLRVTVKPLMN